MSRPPAAPGRWRCVTAQPRPRTQASARCVLHGAAYYTARSSPGSHGTQQSTATGAGEGRRA